MRHAIHGLHRFPSPHLLAIWVHILHIFWRKGKLLRKSSFLFGAPLFNSLLETIYSCGVLGAPLLLNFHGPLF